jgi:hypothetical protein
MEPKEIKFILADLDWSMLFNSNQEREALLKSKTAPLPKPTIKVGVIEEDKHGYYVEVLNDTSKGKTDRSNTDRYGSKTYVYKEATQEIETENAKP